MGKFRLLQSERVCRRQFQIVENTVEKGEIAHYKQFLLFHSVFKKLVLQTSKTQGLFGKGLSYQKDTKL